MRRIIWRAAIILALIWTGVPLFIAGGSMYLMLHPPCLTGAEEFAPFQPVNLTTRDGIRLQGWWLPPRNGVVVLVLGGQGGSRDAMLDHAQILARYGYGVVTAGYRNCAGQVITLGYTEVEDLRAMVEFAQKQPGVQRLAVLGFSVGGATAIRGAARMPELAAVIAEGNFADLNDLFLSGSSSFLSLEWQIQRWMVVFYALNTGIWPTEVSPLADLKRISPRPVLLIHGELEIGRTRGREQYAALGEPRRLWLVPGAEHGQYLVLAPEEYERQVISFLDSAVR